MTKHSKKPFVAVVTMPAVAKKPSPGSSPPLPGGTTVAAVDELISTPAAAALMGLSEATLRNYSWLNSLSAEERAERHLQEPPAGLPVAKRRSGRLMWPLSAVTMFAEQKSKLPE